MKMGKVSWSNFAHCLSVLLCIQVLYYSEEEDHSKVTVLIESVLLKDSLCYETYVLLSFLNKILSF